MKDLQGKVAVITGGASGIGRAVAERAAGEGMKIVLADIEEGPLKEAVDELTGEGAEALGVVTDVSDAASVRELRDRALDRFGAVHLVHNNAGIGAAAVPSGRSARRTGAGSSASTSGASSTASPPSCPCSSSRARGTWSTLRPSPGLIAAPFLGPYNATKQAVVAISETLYKDLQAVGAPVGVSVLCPGFVRTRIAESEPQPPDWAPEREVDGEDPGELRGAVQSMVDGGIPAPVVAERVIDAVRTDTFYILTHPELAVAIRTRFDDILEGRSPSATIVA